MSYDEILKLIKSLETKQIISTKRYPQQNRQRKTHICVQFFSAEVSTSCIKNSNFQSDMKVADVTSCCTKKSKTSKDNYRQISILPNISKIYKRCILKQMQLYFDNILPRYQYGFVRVTIRGTFLL